MKKIISFTVLLLLIAGKATFGQNVFTINKLYAQDTLVNGWLFHQGDDKEWAGSDFDDKQWKPVDPGIDITKFGELKKSGIGWIRVHIQADSSITKQQLIAWVSQYTASEIYLDGKLLRKYGKIDAGVRANNPQGDLIKLGLTPNAEHVIAVKLAYQAGLPYSSTFFTPLPAFRIYINSLNSAFYNYKQNQQTAILNAILSSLFAGFFFIITLIYLTYFIFDRAQKIYFYYCIYAFCVFLLSLAFAISVDNVSSVTFQMLLSFGILLFFVASSLLMLLTIYFLFDYKKRLLFKFYVVAGLACLIFALFNDIWGVITCTNVFLGICLLEAIRISIIALLRKQKGAMFILIALTISCIVDACAPFLDQTTILATLLTLLATFGFPLGMSVYLGIQNAKTNQRLRFTLVEVQQLSEQNLLKEQEKQAILAAQNERLELEVSVRTAELNMSLNTLKSTQTQLIQSEKMASLGELTAGIAHEMQKPLNFVNNFSEVSIELLQELKAESKKLKVERDEQLEAELVNDLIENQTQINHHGKRADAIVKGMLEHSRTHSGQKELTDINALAEEYLRLSYHGLRAKDKSFKAEMVTHFDEKLPKINVVPQDIGRVMLNIFNNAFYAVNEHKKVSDTDYEPTVEVSTSSANGQLVIKVKDNGIGMPDAIKDKIMQPFFTTKPTGEGTGLGLSLTYDMVVKGHGGTIEVNSIEGEGSQFIIQLPLN